MDQGSLPETFRSPPAEYGPAPLLVFNDEHEGVAGEARITEALEGHERVGYGGVFLHPRPGLMTEYLSTSWFELVRHAVSECGRLGLTPYLYDENSYPSGFAGGHVPARVPEAMSRYVGAVFGEGPDSVPEDRVSLYTWKDRRPGERIEASEIEAGRAWVAFVMRSMQPLSWHGETVYPSLLDPRAAETFLETTYEAHARELGELWEDVPAVFTDEPHLPAEGHGPWSPGLHITPYLLGQFRQRKNYDLRDHLPSVFYDTGDYRRVRFDLYDIMHELWVENWALPMEGWCEGRGVALTGHYLEHDWPCPYATPGGSSRSVVWLCTDDLGAIAAKALAAPRSFVGKDLPLANDVQSLDECRSIYREVMGRNPRRFPMPVWLFERFGFVGTDLTTMWRWLRTATIDLDTAPTRAIHPDALTVRGWLSKQKAAESASP